MQIYTPTFLRIKALLEGPIMKFVHGYNEVQLIEIMKHIKDLKEKNPEDCDYKLVDFIYHSDWSDQVHEVVVDLIRDCILREEDDCGYKLTSYGKSLVEKLNEKS